MIKSIIKWWKGEVDPDKEFCDDHEWVGSKSLNEKCPEREEIWKLWGEISSKLKEIDKLTAEIESMSQ